MSEVSRLIACLPSHSVVRVRSRTDTYNGKTWMRSQDSTGAITRDLKIAGECAKGRRRIGERNKYPKGDQNHRGLSPSTKSHIALLKDAGGYRQYQGNHWIEIAA